MHILYELSCLLTRGSGSLLSEPHLAAKIYPHKNGATLKSLGEKVVKSKVAAKKWLQ